MSDQQDTGFLDPAIVRQVAAEGRARADKRRASIVRRQAELLLEVVDYPVDHGRLGLPAILRQAATNVLQRLAHLFGKGRQGIAQRHAHGDLQGTYTLDPRLRFAERIFELNYAFFSGHPDLPPSSDDLEASEPTDSAHRLSGDAK